MFDASLRILKFMFVALLLVFSVHKAAFAGSLLSLCNETDETLYIASRTENGWLTGGGFITAGWVKLTVRGIFRNCYRTNVAKGWTKHFVVAVARGNGFVPMVMNFRGTGHVAKSRMCVSTHLGEFSYRSSNRNSNSCSAGYVLVQATVNVSGGDRDATLDLYGSVGRDAQPIIGVEPTKEELAAAKAREKRESDAKWEAIRLAQKKKAEIKREEERVKAERAAEVERLSAMSDTEIFLEMRKNISKDDERTRNAWESVLTDNIVALCQPDHALNDVLILDSMPEQNIGISLVAMVSNDSWLPTPKQIREAWDTKPDEKVSVATIVTELKYVKNPRKLRQSYLRNELVNSNYWEEDKNNWTGYFGWTVEMFKHGGTARVSPKREPHLCIHNDKKTPPNNHFDLASASRSVCFGLKLRSRIVEGQVPNVDIVRMGSLNTRAGLLYPRQPTKLQSKAVDFKDVMNCARN